MADFIVVGLLVDFDCAVNVEVVSAELNEKHEGVPVRAFAIEPLNQICFAVAHSVMTLSPIANQIPDEFYLDNEDSIVIRDWIESNGYDIPEGSIFGVWAV